MSDDAESGRWLKIKADMPSNEKVSALSDAAFRLHISAKCWCADKVTDGRMKKHVPATLPRAPQGDDLKACIKELLKAGLWHRTTTGYKVHDFLKYNMSRSDYRKKKEAGKLGGQQSGRSRRRSKSEAPASAKPEQPPKRKPSTRATTPQAEYEDEYDQRNATAKDLTGSARADAEAAAAGVLSLDPGERARLLLENQSLAPMWRPECWPEVLGFVSTALDAAGRPQATLGSLRSDKLVRLLVERLAAGEAARLAEAAPFVGAWLAEAAPDGKRRQLSWLSLDILRTAYDDATSAAEREAGVASLIHTAKQSLGAGGAS